jgi:hypothetical protein
MQPTTIREAVASNKLAALWTASTAPPFSLFTNTLDRPGAAAAASSLPTTSTPIPSPAATPPADGTCPLLRLPDELLAMIATFAIRPAEPVHLSSTSPTRSAQLLRVCRRLSAIAYLLLWSLPSFYITPRASVPTPFIGPLDFDATMSVDVSRDPMPKSWEWYGFQPVLRTLLNVRP